MYKTNFQLCECSGISNIRENPYLVHASQMANPEHFACNLVEADSETEIVLLPGQLDHVGAVDVRWHYDGCDGVTDPLILLGGYRQAPCLDSFPVPHSTRPNISALSLRLLDEDLRPDVVRRTATALWPTAGRGQTANWTWGISSCRFSASINEGHGVRSRTW